MAVYKRAYRGYDGPPTPAWPRFFILIRYSFARIFQSKILLMFLAACLFYPLACVGYIYLAFNFSLLATLGVPGGRLPEVDGRFFYFFCSVQGLLSYLLVAIVSPSLISWDLTNGALPLYFCRPISRLEYFAGKLGVLLGLLSVVTWIPATILFSIEGSMSGWAWVRENLWLAVATVEGLAIWIVVISLLGLALSALARRKLAAGTLILGVFFAGAGFGSAINALMRTGNGSLINLTQIIHTIWSSLLRYDTGSTMQPSSAWLVLSAISAVSLWILARRLRAFEVVK